MTKRDQFSCVQRAPRLQTAAAMLSMCCAAACDWTVFDALEGDAPVRVLSAPKGYRRGGYGAVVVTSHQTFDGSDVSRIAASAGADSPVIVQRIWNGEALTEGTTIRCKQDSACDKGVGIGASLIPVPVWGRDLVVRGAKLEQQSCLFAPGVPAGYMFCETNANANQFLDLSKVPKIDHTTVRFSGAGLPENSPLGVALVAAQWIEARTDAWVAGRLYRLPDVRSEAPPPLVEVALLDPATGAPFADDAVPNDLGYRVAVAQNGAGELVLALSQPARHRVIVATLDRDAEGDHLKDALHTRACIKSPDPAILGFGKVLVLGDIDDDGEPEVFIGIDPLDGKNKQLQRVYMYGGASLPDVTAVDGGVCPPWDDGPVNVSCVDGIRGIGCAATAFGASLAVGDVNGDGFGDLFAGAPKATVQGHREAGVVWVIPGSATGLVPDEMTNLYATGLGSGDHLGTSVAALRTRGRDEPVAGAPGGDAVYVFMCSPLEGDVSPSHRCLPK